MKNKWLVNGLLAMVIVIGTVCFANANDNAVLATESTVEDVTPDGVDYIVEKHTSISEYRTEGNFKAPSIQNETVTGEWVFAGWFKNVECTTALGSTENTVAGTPYYAKFVSADVLSVKCQISTGTTPDSESTLLRCVSSVDSLKYSKIGFDLVTPDVDEETGEKIEKNMESSSVGKRIRVTEDKASNPYSYSPKVVDTESEYFYSSVEEIGKDNFNKGYLVKPYWITKDGTKVYGVSRYVTVNEGLNKDVIYIPVKMDETAAESTTKVTVGESEATKVVYDIDGGYAHFALSVDTSGLNSVTKYTVSIDEDETSTYIYRNLGTKYTGTNTQDTTWYNSSDDEFVIATSADLYGLASIVSGGSPLTSKTIYLVSDITVNDMTVEKMLSDNSGAVSWSMIGNNTTNYFNGQFDGQGHTISGLYGKNNNGMFGYAAECTIKNFSLKNSVFTGNVVGSIAYQFDGVMENVYSDAYITCSSAQSHVGGMIGRLTNSSAGGRTASNSKSSISDCWFDGTINITYSSTGDLNCGGIVGNRAAGSGHTVSNCLFTGAMTINHTIETATGEKSINVGGILGGTGSNTCVVAGCFSAGSASVTVADTTHFIKKIGAIAGSGTGVTIKEDSCVYAKEAWEDRIIYDDAENANAISLVGKHINTHESYLNMPGLDYYKSSNKTGHWVVRESGIPVLKTFADEWIDVAWYYDNINSSSYSIATAQELYGLSVLSQENSFEDKTINITKNIVMNSGKAIDWADGKNLDNLRSWTPIGMVKEYPFKGIFEGNGYTISGIYCKPVDGMTGFIGRLSGGVLQNIQLKNSYVSRVGSNVGGAVGYFYGGKVNSVYCDAIVNQTAASGQYVGGIVGFTGNEVEVTNCWFAGTVKSSGKNVGGIVGYVNAGSARITDCLMTGKVLSDYTESEMCTGGIVGGCGQAHWYLTRCLMAGQMNAADSTKTAIAPLVGSPALAVTDDSNTSSRTRKITDSYAATTDYTALVGATSNVILTDSSIVTSSAQENVPNLFVEGSTTWTTDENGNAVLNF